MKKLLAFMAFVITGSVYAMPAQLVTDLSQVKEVIERVEVEHHVECTGKNISVIPGITKNKDIQFKCRGETTKFKLQIKTKLLKTDDGYRFEVQKYTVSSLLF